MSEAHKVYATHAAWASAFQDFAWANAFGATSTSTRRLHMHLHNAIVIAAAADLKQAERACAAFEFALEYTPAPGPLVKARADAARRLRSAEKDARLAIDSERRRASGEIPSAAEAA